jgi:hypothetical protein
MKRATTTNTNSQSILPQPIQGTASSQLLTLAVVHEDDVRSRAYLLYVERGYEPGHAAEDWLQAEAQLRT